MLILTFVTEGSESLLYDTSKQDNTGHMFSVSMLEMLCSRLWLACSVCRFGSFSADERTQTYM